MTPGEFDEVLAEAGERARAIPFDEPALPVASSERLLLLDTEALSAPLWDQGDDPALLAGPAAVASLGTRARAVAYTRPLHDLEANKVRLGGDSWSRLNLVELGFHAVDVIALRMDFDAGARHDDVIASVASLAQLQDPLVPDPERVGEKVLSGLIAGRSAGDADAHQSAYGTWGSDGYVSRRFDYALVTEHVDDAGEPYLRATNEAITVLIGALELDVESAQIAAELRLQELVKRGLLSAAVEEARRARYRSIQYQEQIRRQLADARLHLSEPGALGAVDQVIDHALEHVVDRYRAERSIIANVTAARDETVDERNRRRANQLIAELEHCERQHQRLHHRLFGARAEFREAHATQLAVPPAPPSRVDIERQLLRPTLEATLGAADRLATLVFRLTAAPSAPTAVDPEYLLAALCALPAAQDNLGDEIDDSGELLDAPLRRWFDDDAWDVADKLLDHLETPVLLSSVVADAERRDPSGAVAHLVALRAMHAFDPGLAERLRDDPADDLSVLLVAPSTETFTSPSVSGDDLWLAAGWVTATLESVLDTGDE